MDIPAGSSTENTSASAEDVSVDAEDIALQPDSVEARNATGGSSASEVDAAAGDENSAGTAQQAGDSLPPAAVEDSQDAEPEAPPVQTDYDHTEEVPALLGKADLSDDTEAENVPDQDSAMAEPAPTDDVMNVDTVDDAISGEDALALPELQDGPLQADTVIECPEPVAPQPDAGLDVKIILESLQESMAIIQAVSAKIDMVSSDTECLIKQVHGISSQHDVLSEELQAIASGGAAKNFLSKTFLTFSSLIIAMLVIFQCYTFVSLLKTQRQQDAGVSAVLGNMSSLNKKLAGYDKNVTKALLNPPQQQHAQPHAAAAENTGHEATEAGSAPAAAVPEKINRLRNGLPEKKLIRKESGDWFVYTRKSEECIADSDVIEALNQAYKKIGRSIPAGFPMPAHNALCVLKPDGKGGTEIVMTKNYVP